MWFCFYKFYTFFLFITLPSLWHSPNFPWHFSDLAFVLFFSFLSLSKRTVSFLLRLLFSGEYLVVSVFRGRWTQRHDTNTCPSMLAFYFRQSLSAESSYMYQYCLEKEISYHKTLCSCSLLTVRGLIVLLLELILNWYNFIDVNRVLQNYTM